MTHPIQSTYHATDDDIRGLVITAVEHMGHGCLRYMLTPEQLQEYVEKHYSDIIASALLAGEDVGVEDRWDYDLSGTLSLVPLLEAIGVEAERRDMSVESFIKNSDVLDADCVMQRAAFGDILLG